MKRYITLFFLNLLTLNLFALDPSIDFRNFSPSDIINDKNSIIENDEIVKHITTTYNERKISISIRAKKDSKDSLLMSFHSDDFETLFTLYKEYLCEYLNDSISFVCYDDHCKDGINIFYKIYQINKPSYTICSTVDYSFGFFMFGIMSTELDCKYTYKDLEDLWPIDLKVGFLDDSLITPEDIEEIPTEVIFYKNIKTDETSSISYKDFKIIELENNKTLLKKLLFIENENLTGIKISCTDKLKKNPEFLTQKVKINDNQIYTMYDLLQNPKCKFDICNKITFSFSVSDEVIKEMKKNFSVEVY